MSILESFRRLIPVSAKRHSRGWVGFNCSACREKRGRGRFLETETGGFRYMCYNGGCEFEKATGWEPEDRLIGRRVRQLYELLGGDTAELVRSQNQTMNRSDWIKWMLSDNSAINPAARNREVANTFPEIALPPSSQLLWEAMSTRALEVQDYVRGRCDIFEQYPFYWTLKYPKHVIVPLIHNAKNIGWIARKTTAGSDCAHMKCPGFPSDFMLNQDTLYQYDTVLVCEGQFDAIAIQGLCTFGNKLTQKQINLLNQSHRKIALIPDYQGDEWRAYWQTAKQNGWSLSTPPWEDTIKDVGEAIQHHGLLATMDEIMRSISNDYDAASEALCERSARRVRRSTR